MLIHKTAIPHFFLQLKIWMCWYLFFFFQFIHLPWAQDPLWLSLHPQSFSFWKKNLFRKLNCALLLFQKIVFVLGFCFLGFFLQKSCFFFALFLNKWMNQSFTWLAMPISHILQPFLTFFSFFTYRFILNTFTIFGISSKFFFSLEFHLNKEKLFYYFIYAHTLIFYFILFLFIYFFLHFHFK